MKIWIDLTNSPHVNFFKPFVVKWEKEGHSVVFTSRGLANTLDLIEQNGWEHTIVGTHAGKGKLGKVFNFPCRVWSLWMFLKNVRPDVGISHSSFYSPLVCKLLGISSVYLNDNEFAQGNKLAFRFATVNMLPAFLRTRAEALNWTHSYAVEFYPGIKEGIYLSQIPRDSISQRRGGRIYIRLEPWTAAYYKGSSGFLDELIIALSKKNEVRVLPRDAVQRSHFMGKRFEGIGVVSRPLRLEEIVADCRLFIGAGGSMTRELAYFGIPTISVYQGELLEVDKYLVSIGAMEHFYNPTLQRIEKFMDARRPRMGHLELEKQGKLAFQMIENKLKDLVKA